MANGVAIVKGTKATGLMEDIYIYNVKLKQIAPNKVSVDLIWSNYGMVILVDARK